MKSVSISLIRRFRYHRRIQPLLHLNYISDASSSSSSFSLFSPTRKISTCCRTNPLIKSQFWVNPYRSFNTHVVEEPPETSPGEKEKMDLAEAFFSAGTTDEMVRLFKEMELSFQEDELAAAALLLAIHLDRQGADPEKVLTYAHKSLQFSDEHDKALECFDGDAKEQYYLVAAALKSMGSANYALKRFNDSLGYLNRAHRILVKLEADGDNNVVKDIGPVLLSVHLELANVKNAMGRREEAIEHLKKTMELKEMLLQTKEMGLANQSMAESCIAVPNFDEALPYALKALELHKQDLGNDSAEVAHDRMLLGVVYSGLDQHDKALEQNQLSQRIFKNRGMKLELAYTQIKAANVNVALGNYEEAIDLLKSVVQQTDKDCWMRAMAFTAMSKALVKQQKFADSKKCLELACEILQKKETAMPANLVAGAYSEVAMEYESTNEFEAAISLLQKTLTILEKLSQVQQSEGSVVPQEQHSERSVSARIGWLLLFSGRVSQAVPHLEAAAEMLKESFGAKHFAVGYVYNILGAAYLELGRPQSAAQMFAVAKDILCCSNVCSRQDLSKAYAGIGMGKLAVEFQQQVIDAWDNAKDEMKEVKPILEDLRLKARGGVSIIHS